MTGEELVRIAVKLSGLPPAKNRKGHGAMGWLQQHFDVHQTTISRWVRGPERSGSRIPRYVQDELRRMERELGT